MMSFYCLKANKGGEMVSVWMVPVDVHLYCFELEIPFWASLIQKFKINYLRWKWCLN